MENLILGLIILSVIIYVGRKVWRAFHQQAGDCSSGCQNCPFSGECCDPNSPKPIIKEIPKK